MKNKGIHKITLERILKISNNIELREITIGKILGDGYINKEGNLTIMQSIKQKDYVFHLYEKYKEYVNKEPKIKVNYRNGIQNQCYWFMTQAIFKEYEKLFYVNDLLTNKRRKIIPSNIEELLTARGLAYWIMEDGTYDYGIVLCTYSLTIEEVRYSLITID